MKSRMVSSGNVRFGRGVDDVLASMEGHGTFAVMKDEMEMKRGGRGKRGLSDGGPGGPGYGSQ